MMSRGRLGYVLAMILVVGSSIVFGQKPAPTATPDDKPETVLTEEIKVSFSAVDTNGKFVPNLKKEDIVITEGNTLHQASSISHLPASILIVLDTGGEDRQAKSIGTTRKAAKALINSLQENDSVALIQYNDDVKVLSDWTTDRAQLMDALNKQLNFGKRSKFTDGLNYAVKYFNSAKTDNRHMVLITDGLDSVSPRADREAAFKNVLATDINVHVISWTGLEQQVVAARKKSISGGGTKRPELPPGAGIPIQGQTQTFPIATVNLDRAMVRKNRERGEALLQSEKDLTQLTDDTNGEIYVLKETESYQAETEVSTKASTLAGNIDSQYVLTYTPKTAVGENDGEDVRLISVTSRRSDVLVQGRRKFIVTKSKL